MADTRPRLKDNQVFEAESGTYKCRYLLQKNSMAAGWVCWVRSSRGRASSAVESALDATCGFGQASHFTGSFARSRGKKFVDIFQLEAGDLGKDSHHGGDAVLFEVIL